MRKHCNFLAKAAEEDKRFAMCKEPKGNVWFCDPQGVSTSGYGLCFSAEDMAKIGLLCLNKGKVNVKHIVSSRWINTISTKAYLAGKEFRDMMYGYLWWTVNAEKTSMPQLAMALAFIPHNHKIYQKLSN